MENEFCNIRLLHFSIEHCINRPERFIDIHYVIQAAFSWYQNGLFIIQRSFDISHYTTGAVDGIYSVIQLFVVFSIFNCNKLRKQPHSITIVVQGYEHRPIYCLRLLL